MCFLKNAILLEWIHIFVPTGRRNYFWWTGYIVMAINAVLYIVGVVLSWFVCSPREKRWAIWEEGTCVNQKNADITVSVFNLLTGLIILILPQKVIWNLNLETSRRAGISLAFSVGLL